MGSAGTYVHSSKLTVDQACEAWLVSKHALKPSTLAGHRVSLGPLRDELGHIEVQKLSKTDLDTLVGRLRRGEVQGRKKWTPRSCNYLLYLTMVTDTPKSKASNRTLPLPDEVVAVLEAARKRQSEERLAFRRRLRVQVSMSPATRPVSRTTPTC